MKSTTTVHTNAGEIALRHNQRDEELCKNEPHIDLYNKYGNSFHEVLYRSDLTDKYSEIFSDAIDAYNAKQTRKDRQITVESYMQSVYDDTRGKRQTKKVNGKRVPKSEEESRKKGKQLSYEVTYKVGNTEVDRDGKGHKRYFRDKEIRSEYLPRAVQQATLRRYYEDFQKRNPAFRIVNADMHCDEGYINKKGKWEYACDGLHLEFIPVATGFKQGLEVQNSLNKALKAMGFGGADGYTKWAEREQEYLAEIAKEEYNDYSRAMGHRDTLTIYRPVHSKAKQGDMDKEQFIKNKELEDKAAELQDLCEELEKQSEEIETKREEVENLRKQLESERQELDALKSRLQAIRAHNKQEADKIRAEKLKWQERANTELSRYKSELREKANAKVAEKVDALKAEYTDKLKQLADAIATVQAEKSNDEVMETVLDKCVYRYRSARDGKVYSLSARDYYSQIKARRQRTIEQVMSDVPEIAKMMGDDTDEYSM